MLNLNEKYFTISERRGRNHQNKFCLRPLKGRFSPWELKHMVNYDLNIILYSIKGSQTFGQQTWIFSPRIVNKSERVRIETILLSWSFRIMSKHFLIDSANFELSFRIFDIPRATCIIPEHASFRISSFANPVKFEHSSYIASLEQMVKIILG